jgi:hypothetical protein
LNSIDDEVTLQNDITLYIGCKILIQEYTRYNKFIVIAFENKDNQIFIKCVDKNGVNCTFSDTYFSRYGSVISEAEFKKRKKNISKASRTNVLYL